MDIDVIFFGVLADIAGISQKHYRSIESFDDLSHRIMDDFPELLHYNYRVAVNNEIIDENPVLRDGDEIAYLPPFAGD